MCTVCGCGGEAQVGLAYVGLGGVRAKPAAGARPAAKSANAPHQWRALGGAVSAPMGSGPGETPRTALKPEEPSRILPASADA